MNRSIIKGHIMKTLAENACRFLVEEDGPTAVEYAVMLAMIFLVCIAAITIIGTITVADFDDVSKKMNG